MKSCRVENECSLLLLWTPAKTNIPSRHIPTFCRASAANTLNLPFSDSTHLLVHKVYFTLAKLRDNTFLVRFRKLLGMLGLKRDAYSGLLDDGHVCDLPFNANLRPSQHFLALESTLHYLLSDSDGDIESLRVSSWCQRVPCVSGWDAWGRYKNVSVWWAKDANRLNVHFELNIKSFVMWHTQTFLVLHNSLFVSVISRKCGPLEDHQCVSFIETLVNECSHPLSKKVELDTYCTVPAVVAIPTAQSHWWQRKGKRFQPNQIFLPPPSSILNSFLPHPLFLPLRVEENFVSPFHISNQMKSPNHE